MAVCECGQGGLEIGEGLYAVDFAGLDQRCDAAPSDAAFDEMLAAIRDRDIERADSLARLHTRQFRDNFMDFMKRTYLCEASLVPLGTPASAS